LGELIENKDFFVHLLSALSGVNPALESDNTARLATAGEAEKWRKTVALEHKRNAE
jgi:hypothetical protein